VFIFAQASAFKLPMITKKEHVQYIVKNNVTTSDRNSTSDAICSTDFLLSLLTTSHTHSIFVSFIDVDG